MAATRTVLAVDVTALAEFAEGMAVWAEGEAAKRADRPELADFYVGEALAYRTMLDAFTAMAVSGTVEHDCYVR